MHLLPDFMKLDQMKYLVAGADFMAYQKIKLLLETGANVSLFTLNPPCKEIQKRLQDGDIQPIDEKIEELEVRNYKIIIAGTGDLLTDQMISEKAQSFNIPVNVINRPELCSFLFPSIVDRSPLIIAISSCGKSPTLSRLVHEKISTLIPQSYGDLSILIGEYQEQIKLFLGSYEDKKTFWKNILYNTPLVEKFIEGQEESIRQQLENELSKLNKN